MRANLPFFSLFFPLFIWTILSGVMIFAFPLPVMRKESQFGTFLSRGAVEKLFWFFFPSSLSLPPSGSSLSCF